jgi:nucleotide-binding universal stress UspA family protein
MALADTMLNIKTILLPVDFQDPSLSLVHQAACVARQFHSALVLLHVVTPLSYSSAMLEGGYVPTSREELLQHLIGQAQKDLDRCLQPELAGLPVKRVLVQGDPAREIVQAARAESADLIMMPTHGRKGFRRFILGSVTAKVLHDSSVSVWTAAHLEDAPSPGFPVRKIACGIDLGLHSRSLAAWVVQMAAVFQAQLTLVHITAGLDAYGPAPEWKATLADLAARQIAELQSAVGSKAQVVIQSGDVAKLLNQVALQEGADLLVVGRSPSPGHLGGTGYGIIRESRIPVVSVRQPHVV